MAVLTSGELAMERAILSAAASLAAPSTSMVIELPRAFAVAHDLLGQRLQHLRQRFFEGLRRRLDAEAPLASTARVSLVEVSPSTEIRL